MNLLDGTVQVGASLIVNVHHHCARLGSLFDILFRVNNHEVNIQWFGADFGYSFKDRESEGNVWYEDTVHNVHMEPVCFTLVDHFYIALQVNEIGRED